MADIGSQFIAVNEQTKASGSKSRKPTAKKRDAKGTKENKVKGVHVLDTGFETNSALMAGYLNLPNTDALRDFTDHMTFKAIYDPWAKARDQDFGLPQITNKRQTIPADQGPTDSLTTNGTRQGLPDGAHGV